MCRDTLKCLGNKWSVIPSATISIILVLCADERSQVEALDRTQRSPSVLSACKTTRNPSGPNWLRTRCSCQFGLLESKLSRYQNFLEPLTSTDRGK